MKNDPHFPCGPLNVFKPSDLDYAVEDLDRVARHIDRVVRILYGQIAAEQAHGDILALRRPYRRRKFRRCRAPTRAFSAYDRRAP